MKGRPQARPPIDIPTAQPGGTLVRIPTGTPGLCVQMTEAEARERGLLPPEPKERRPLLNKLRKQLPENKGA